MNISTMNKLGIFVIILSFLSAEHAVAASGSKAGNKKPVTWAAISYSPKTGSYGYATQQDSKRSALKEARRACRKHANDCSRRNTGWTRLACMSLATDPGGGWGMHFGDSKSQARKKALKKCSSYKNNTACKSYVTICQ